ncbi:MAG: hypothetical protein F2667_07560 [Actinobacteria bacterium]|uniref:Unannotated protein n=1 Tax=freshwater metagenome TaxID=449393 RepID=A0A6J6QF79_9ZZZZ|nr:hypothetical protein [Actinomycetota bacterium]
MSHDDLPDPDLHVRGENALPGATTEPTLGFSTPPEAKIHPGDPQAADLGIAESEGTSRPLVYAVLAVVIMLGAIALLSLL